MSRIVYAKGWANFVATLHVSAPIVLICFVIPYILFNAFFDVESLGALRELRNLELNGHDNFLNILSVTMNFYSSFFVGLACLWFLVLLTYFAMTELAVAQHRKEVLSRTKFLKKALFLSVTKGFMFSFLLFLLLMFFQIITIPALFLVFLFFTIPVVIIAEHRGVFSAIGYVFRLRFLRNPKYTTWQFVMSLFSLAAGVYFIEFLLLYLGTSVMHLGGDFGAWYSQVISGTPYTISLLVSKFISLFALMLLFFWLPFIASALYFEVIHSRKIAKV